MIARRRLIRTGLGLAGSLAAGPAAMAALAAPVRRVAFDNLHTGEKLAVAYYEGGAYVPDALAAVNRVLRDFRTGEVHLISPRLLDLLTVLSATVETRAAFGVISGYRSPQTNAMLHAESSQVAAGSLHIYGEAIDVRLADIDSARLRDAALGMAIGGVGYYPTSDFVHVDIGRVRRWEGA
jgi:uncharacterized protein YcbK (DUF882 family)